MELNDRLEKGTPGFSQHRAGALLSAKWKLLGQWIFRMTEKEVMGVTRLWLLQDQL